MNLIMSVLGPLVLIRGVLRLLISAYMGWTALVTWQNPHPVGKQVTPELFLALFLIFLDLGYTSLQFYFSSPDPATYIQPDGAVGFLAGSLIEVVFLGYAFYRLQRVTKSLTGPLR